ncbi:MAG: hypothetical protein ACYDAP_11535 [Thermoplasmataceae archaeon]
MNRKIMILMVAVVATVLPAVAVADVMITGSVSVLGTNVQDSFYLTEGPNYAVANETGVLGFIPAQSGVASMGTIDLEGMSNLSVSMINVLEFHYDLNAPGVVYLNITSTDFPSTSYVAFNSSLMTTEFGPTPPSNSYPLSTTGNYTINVNSAPSSGIYYIGFYLPAGTYGGLSLSLSMTYVPSNVPS